MEKYLMQKYRELTGKDPGRIVLVDTADSTPASVKEFEFIDIEKVKSTYKLQRITAIHKRSKKDYSGTSVLLGRFCTIHLAEAWNDLKDHERITIPIYGSTLKEIAEKRRRVCDEIKGEHPTKTDFFNVLNGLCITDGFLLKRPYEILSNDDYAAASFVVLNEHGFHARPSSLFVKQASKYDCDIYVKNGASVASGKSIMGMLTLEAAKDSRLVCAAAGSDSGACIQDLVDLVRSPKFLDESLKH